MKIVDADATHPEGLARTVDLSGDADTHASPGLRPEVLGDAAQRHTKAMVHAALFKGTDEAPTIGPYQVLKRLGEGGMGVVYAAYDDKLERKVALKLIRGAAMRRPEGRARTLREARALARVSHPNVVHVYQVGEVDDEIYVAMEFLTGPTLRGWLDAQRRGWQEVLAVFRQAGEGLAAAHRQGVVHRDFKPANVIVGDDGRVRVLDFGLAHFGEQAEAIKEVMKALPPAGEVTDVLLTQTGAVLGTPAYMAAEQFAGGRGDAKTDQFSFCTALYEALNGQRPFAGDKLDALASAVASGQLAPVKAGRDVPAWLHRVVNRGLAPDPASRWPSMDALLVALTPPAKKPRWGRIAAISGSVFALLIGSCGYVFMMSSPPRPGRPPLDDGAGDPAAALARAEVTRSQDEKLLLEARAALTSDPVESIRALARLAGDDASTWQRAHFYANAAEARGLPSEVLRAGGRELLEVRPLAGGGYVARDDLGAVWQWKLSEKTGTQVLPPGAATGLVVARDAPVWAVVQGKTIQVYGAGLAQTIELGSEEATHVGWQLASDGRTLSASRWSKAMRGDGLRLWDLTRPGSAPTAYPAAEGTIAVIADDASLVVAAGPKGLRVVRPRDGVESTLKYRGRPSVLSADQRFLIAHPRGDDDGKLDVVELATGKTRRVLASEVTVLGGSDVLFKRTEYGRPWLRRESLATGEVAWSLPVPDQARFGDLGPVVDPAHGRFMVPLGEQWGVGDLERGELRTFLTVPKDRVPQWAGEDALMLAVGDELRIHRPATSPLQVHQYGSTCDLSPAGRWALLPPRDLPDGEFMRVELATGATASFRCPSQLPPHKIGDFATYSAWGMVDDAGQVAMAGPEGWSCWFDDKTGAHTGPALGDWKLAAALPRGVVLKNGAEVEVRSGPDDRVQRWTAAGEVMKLEASPTGAAIAVRSDRGLQVLRVDTGAVMDVHMESTPMDTRVLFATAMAWSPDGARLASIGQVDGALELRVWDVTGEPRELDRHVVKDSPGRPSNHLQFTPSGESVALTGSRKLMTLVTPGSHETRQVEGPEYFRFHMRSETEAVGIDTEGLPFLVDFAAGEVSSLTPNTEYGFATAPPMRLAEDGSLWTCAALGPGTLVEFKALDEAASRDPRGRIARLAAPL